MKEIGGALFLLLLIVVLFVKCYLPCKMHHDDMDEDYYNWKDGGDI